MRGVFLAAAAACLSAAPPSHGFMPPPRGGTATATATLPADAAAGTATQTVALPVLPASTAPLLLPSFGGWAGVDADSAADTNGGHGVTDSVAWTEGGGGGFAASPAVVLRLNSTLLAGLSRARCTAQPGLCACAPFLAPPYYAACTGGVTRRAWEGAVASLASFAGAAPARLVARPATPQRWDEHAGAVYPFWAPGAGGNAAARRYDYRHVWTTGVERALNLALHVAEAQRFDAWRLASPPHPPQPPAAAAGAEGVGVPLAPEEEAAASDARAAGVSVAGTLDGVLYFVAPTAAGQGAATAALLGAGGGSPSRRALIAEAIRRDLSRLFRVAADDGTLAVHVAPASGGGGAASALRVSYSVDLSRLSASQLRLVRHVLRASFLNPFAADTAAADADGGVPGRRGALGVPTPAAAAALRERVSARVAVVAGGGAAGGSTAGASAGAADRFVLRSLLHVMCRVFARADAEADAEAAGGARARLCYASLVNAEASAGLHGHQAVWGFLDDVAPAAASATSPLPEGWWAAPKAPPPKAAERAPPGSRKTTAQLHKERDVLGGYFAYPTRVVVCVGAEAMAALPPVDAATGAPQAPASDPCAAEAFLATQTGATLQRLYREDVAPLAAAGAAGASTHPAFAHVARAEAAWAGGGGNATVSDLGGAGVYTYPSPSPSWVDPSLGVVRYRTLRLEVAVDVSAAAGRGGAAAVGGLLQRGSARLDGYLAHVEEAVRRDAAAALGTALPDTAAALDVPGSLQLLDAAAAAVRAYEAAGRTPAAAAALLARPAAAVRAARAVAVTLALARGVASPTREGREALQARLTGVFGSAQLSGVAAGARLSALLDPARAAAVRTLFDAAAAASPGVEADFSQARAAQAGAEGAWLDVLAGAGAPGFLRVRWVEPGAAAPRLVDRLRSRAPRVLLDGAATVEVRLAERVPGFYETHVFNATAFAASLGRFERDVYNRLGRYADTLTQAEGGGDRGAAAPAELFAAATTAEFSRYARTVTATLSDVFHCGDRHDPRGRFGYATCDPPTREGGSGVAASAFVAKNVAADAVSVSVTVRSPAGASGGDGGGPRALAQVDAGLLAAQRAENEAVRQRLLVLAFCCGGGEAAVCAARGFAGSELPRLCSGAAGVVALDVPRSPCAALAGSVDSDHGFYCRLKSRSSLVAAAASYAGAPLPAAAPLRHCAAGGAQDAAACAANVSLFAPPPTVTDDSSMLPFYAAGAALLLCLCCCVVFPLVLHILGQRRRKRQSEEEAAAEAEKETIPLEEEPRAAASPATASDDGSGEEEAEVGERDDADGEAGDAAAASQGDSGNFRLKLPDDLLLEAAMQFGARRKQPLQTPSLGRAPSARGGSRTVLGYQGARLARSGGGGGGQPVDLVETAAEYDVPGTPPSHYLPLPSELEYSPLEDEAAARRRHRAAAPVAPKADAMLGSPGVDWRQVRAMAFPASPQVATPSASRMYPVAGDPDVAAGVVPAAGPRYYYEV